MGCLKLSYHEPRKVLETSPLFLLKGLEVNDNELEKRLSSSTYGFQGQEKDDEIKGEGNSVNYKYRMADVRLGRFFAVDPLIAKYPFYSSYAFSGNRVIDAVELEGLEPYNVNSPDAPPPSTPIGYIYEVPPSRTSSNQSYVGRTEQGSPEVRGKYAKDGRIRLNEDVVSVYDASKPGNGANQEQKQINTHKGGIKNLDNRINAQSEAKFAEFEAKNPSSNNSKTATTTPKLSVPKASTVAKGAGTLMVAYGLYESTGAISNSENPLLQTTKEVTKWGTAYAAAEIGAGVGALTGPAAPVAVPLGALIGGAIGWWVASNAVD